MPIEFTEDRVECRDLVGVAEAEELLEWLQCWPAAQVDLLGCTHLHPATLQVLLAAGTRVAAWPEDASLRAWLETILKGAAKREEDDRDGE